MSARHPIQPIAKDAANVARFKENAIVRFLLERDPDSCNMNTIASMQQFSREDRVQFAQLIGYSLSGFGELSYVSDEDHDSARRMWQLGMDERDARIDTLETTLRDVKESLRDTVVVLFGIHPDDLGGAA